MTGRTYADPYPYADEEQVFSSRKKSLRRVVMITLLLAASGAFLMGAG